MLKTSGDNGSTTWPGKNGVEVGDGNKTRHNARKIDGGKVDGGDIGDDEIGKKVQKTTKSKNPSKSKKKIGSSEFLTLGAKLTFIKLR